MTDADLYFDQYSQIYRYIHERMGKENDIPRLRHVSIGHEPHEAVVSFGTMCKVLDIPHDEARNILRALELIGIYKPNKNFDSKELLVCAVELPERLN